MPINGGGGVVAAHQMGVMVQPQVGAAVEVG